MRKLAIFPGLWLLAVGAGFKYWFVFALFIWVFGIWTYSKAYPARRNLKSLAAIALIVLTSVTLRHLARTYTLFDETTCAGPLQLAHISTGQAVDGPGGASIVEQDDLCDPIVGLAGEEYVERFVFVLKASEHPNQKNLALRYEPIGADWNMRPQLRWVDTRTVKISIPNEDFDVARDRVGSVTVVYDPPPRAAQPSAELGILDMVFELLF